MNWKRKLGSRKFWSLVAVFVTAALILFNFDSETIEKVVALITAGGAVIAYILVEGNIDAKNLNTINIEGLENEFKKEDPG